MSDDLQIVEPDPDRLILHAIIAVCDYEGPHKSDLVRELVGVLVRLNNPPRMVEMAPPNPPL